VLVVKLQYESQGLGAYLQDKWVSKPALAPYDARKTSIPTKTGISKSLDSPLEQLDRVDGDQVYPSHRTLTRRIENREPPGGVSRSVVPTKTRIYRSLDYALEQLGEFPP
jgi:hypothetical protein